MWVAVRSGSIAVVNELKPPVKSRDCQLNSKTKPYPISCENSEVLHRMQRNSERPKAAISDALREWSCLCWQRRPSARAH